jgi:HlyD family secretion protein
MNKRIRQLALIPVLLVVAGLIWLAWAPRASDVRTLSGYVEGEALYLAAPISAPLARINVVRGQRVTGGEELFALDTATLAAQQSQARADIGQTADQAAAAEASVRQLQAAAQAARAQADNAAADARRYTALVRSNSGAVSQQDLDRATTAATATAAQFRAAQAQAAAAAAQLASVRQLGQKAQGGLADVSSRLGYLSPHAPGPGRVEEVFFQAHEWVGANQPVLSLLPDAKIKLRFFVPEPEIGLYPPGAVIRFGCDGCKAGLSARVNYVSPRPEYTPPVIYSRKTRDTLVFLVEAVPDHPLDLVPGQPVDVTPLKAQGSAGR